MKKNKLLQELIPYIVFVVALICKCTFIEAVAMMLLTETFLIKDDLRKMKKALAELADSTKAQ